ncbi:ribonuclease 3-like protein 2 [Carex littledalei]|uniref:Ribonuclease 3-like protein 2 n=1 Tax=Carex littledalei TaxID=544730 RepID=A0A833R2A4_9POAL|nr:ribonuclease 3-like protein 2 [Carex littledalei]
MNPFHIVVTLIKWLYNLFYPHPTVSEAERILGYSFLKPSLLEEALTRISNRRLEFVGDAALNLAMTSYLYSSHRDLMRGRISTLRSANVSNERLARVAVRHNIYPLMRRKTPSLDKDVEEFTKAVMLEQEDQIYGGITKKAPKILADVVEAIAAAIYEDCNFNLDVMWEVVRRLLEPLITADTFSEHPETKLHELCQKSGKEVKFPTRQNGNTFIVEVLVDGVSISYGTAEQMKIAKLNAARHALEKLCGEKSYLLKSQHKKVAEEEKAKHKLYVFCAKRHWPLPVYKLEEKKGPAHNRTFICSVHVKTTNDYLIELGEDRSRVKDAEKSAALKMLSLVGKLYV